jgi:hypothetical protein
LTQQLFSSSSAAGEGGARPAGASGAGGEYEYEYYYDYLDDSPHSTDYDLVPLSAKVRNGYSGTMTILHKTHRSD